MHQRGDIPVQLITDGELYRIERANSTIAASCLANKC